MGVPFERRGTYLDEMLDVLPRLLRGELVEHHGAAYDIPEVELTPAPPRIPILVGGHAPPALRRAARADGWFAPPVPLDATIALNEALAHARRAAGRDEPFTVIVRLPAEADMACVERYRSEGFDDLAISPFRSGLVDPAGSEPETRHALAELATRLGIESR